LVPDDVRALPTTVGGVGVGFDVNERSVCHYCISNYLPFRHRPRLIAWSLAGSASTFKFTAPARLAERECAGVFVTLNSMRFFSPDALAVPVFRLSLLSATFVSLLS
jgi:hypothetical protein